MDILKLTKNITAIKIDPQKDVIVLEFPRPLTESDAQALLDFKEKTGLSVLALGSPVKIHIIDTSGGHNHG